MYICIEGKTMATRVIVLMVVVFVVACPVGSSPNQRSETKNGKRLIKKAVSTDTPKPNATLLTQERPISITNRDVRNDDKQENVNVNIIRKKHKLRHSARRRKRKQQHFLNSNRPSKRVHKRRKNHRSLRGSGMLRTKTESTTDKQDKKFRKKRNFKNTPSSSRDGLLIKDESSPNPVITLEEYIDDQINENSNMIGLETGINPDIEITIEVHHEPAQSKDKQLDSPFSSEENPTSTRGKPFIKPRMSTRPVSTESTPTKQVKTTQLSPATSVLAKSRDIGSRSNSSGSAKTSPDAHHSGQELDLSDTFVDGEDFVTEDGSKVAAGDEDQDAKAEESGAGQNGVGEWSQWTSCSVTCGMGKKDRERKCGEHCKETESVQCWMPPCHVTGSWQKREMRTPNLPTETKRASKREFLNPKVDNCRKWLKCTNKFLLKYIAQLQNLPSCPCTYPVNIKFHGHIWDDQQRRFFTWHDASGKSERLDVYKPNAQFCIRSDLIPGSLAAQHCCYDKKMRLITRGKNAGTYNLISPQLSPALHHKIDILPWIICKGDWTKYNLVRPPNNMRQCPENPDDKAFLKQIREAQRMNS